ncbi:MAG: hypothetical protein ACI9EW_001538 [Cellvibrionaceae bacterium]|jgi:hypothetical protein
MNTNKKTIVASLLLILTLMLTVPAWAHGDDPEEEPVATQAVQADDPDEKDDHAVVDEVSLRNNNSLMVMGGLLGAVLLAGGSGLMFQPRRSTILGLALIGLTGAIHLIVGLAWGDTLLLLNGIGFLGLGALWALPPRFVPNQKRILAIVLAAYTLITFAGYFLTHDHYDFIAIFTKVVELPLLIALAYSAYTAKTVKLNV